MGFIFSKHFMAKSVLTIAFLIAILFNSATNINAQSHKPDFAYPQQVSTQAEKDLQESIKNGNGIGIIRSLINLTIAQGIIDTDNQHHIIEKIEDIVYTEKDPCTKAVLYTLLTDIYCDIYKSDRWKYDSRNNSSTILPDDYTAWDGKQFQNKIISLCDSALANPDALQATSLKDYSAVITQDSYTRIFYPTLYDFIARHSIDRLRYLAPAQNILSYSWLCRYDVYRQMKFTYTSPITQRILSIYQNILAFHTDNKAAFIDCDISRIEFLSESVYQPDNSDDNAGTLDILRDMYNQYQDHEYAADILIAIQQYLNDNTLDKWYYNTINTHLAKFPAYFKNDCLKNILSDLSHKRINFSTQEMIAPDDTLTITITNRNTTNFSVNIYRIPQIFPIPSSFNVNNKNVNQLTPIKSLNLTCEQTVPFRNDTTIQIILGQPGGYIIIPEISGEESSRNGYHKVTNCSNITLLKSKYGTKSWATTVNPSNGAPLKAELFALARNNAYNKITETDYNGHVLLTPKKFHTIFATKDNSCSNTNYFSVSNYEDSYFNTNRIYYGQSFTDLAIYHPGDSVKWSAIAYSIKGKERQLLKNEPLKVTIRDANYQQKDTSTLITDNWGRINGSYKIPIDGLTGSYHIQIGTDFDNNFIYHNFIVSDYKLPTFFIEITEVQQATPEKGAVTLKGKVETLSGFPVSDAALSVNLSVRQFISWWRSSQPISFYSLSAKSNNTGFFSIELPAELLASAPVPNGIFTAEITATSSTGESQETSKSFTIDNAYNIVTSLNENIDISQPVKLGIKLTDFNGNTINNIIRYNLIKQDSIIHSGTFASVNPVVDWRGIPSGKYNITFETTNGIISSPETVGNICLYRHTDKNVPYKTDLWLPITKYEISPDKRNVSVLYGTTASNSHIEYVVWNSDSIYSRKWLTPETGNHRLNIELPDSVNNLTITFRTISKYNCSVKSVHIIVKDSKPTLALKAESFRDKITPGVSETWKFRVTDNSGNGSKSALILDMYTKALDLLQHAYWRFNPMEPNKTSFYAYSEFFHDCNFFISGKRTPRSNCFTINSPAFETFGYSFIPQRNILLTSSSRISPKTAQLEEVVTDYDSGTDNFSAKVNNSQTSEAQESETSNDSKEFSYRQAETPLAFFRPTLETDSIGNLTFSFTAPNANTTWRFNAIAYNEQLLTDALSFDVISNKPIMVQPNLPRFLRSGDTAAIRASVMNNSDTIQTINTIVELFDHATGNITGKFSYIDTVQPKQSAIITSKITAPFDSPIIGYRIKSHTKTFADGEQTLIAILPSLAPVIEAQTFYLNNQKKTYTTTLHQTPDNARVTLQFCENPTWYCVTALPGLRASKSNTSLGAMAAIFSAAIAEGIIRNNPDIASVLHQWQHSNKSDSILTSMLERNTDLKTILLNATPWVMDAQNDSERMTRLALLFDKEEIRQTYSDNINLLAQLQRGKGGWAWFAGEKESSLWCTYNILELCGRLKKLGFLPKDKRLSTMINNAVKQIDDYNARNFAKFPKADYINYVYTRNYFNEIKQSTAAKRVTAATVQRLISDWKNEDVTFKAIAAIILNNNGYHSTSRQILNSIREFSITSASAGMWWPSLNDMNQWSIGKIGATAIILEAFHSIEPSCDDIDMIRQWLILQKEAKDWGTSVVTCDVIASILNTGSQWTNKAQGVSVKVGSHTIEPNKVERITGYFRNDISDLSPSGSTLSIYKTADTPAWGAVYYQYQSSLGKINAVSCDDVAIEKNLYKQVVSSDGKTWIKADSISVGDRIKVELRIKTLRDMDYVAIIDNRAACFEPVEQLPAPIFSEGIYFYRENKDTSTNMYITHMPKGSYSLSYELFVNNSGTFSAGIASIQSQYAPALTAHSSGKILIVNY